MTINKKKQKEKEKLTRIPKAPKSIEIDDELIEKVWHFNVCLQGISGNRGGWRMGR